MTQYICNHASECNSSICQHREAHEAKRETVLGRPVGKACYELVEQCAYFDDSICVPVPHEHDDLLRLARAAGENTVDVPGDLLVELLGGE